MVEPAATDVVLEKSILPLFRCRRSVGGAVPLAYCGTSFIAVPGVAVTCRHCVQDLALPPDEYYAMLDASDATYGQPSAEGRAYLIEDLEHDSRGYDLAIGRVDCPAPPVAPITLEPMTGVGFDVGLVAYPGTKGVFNPSIKSPTFDLQGRWLQGYVTRGFAYTPPDGRPPQPSWELDITAPGGASGAPVIVLAPHPRAGQVVGVVYGRYPAFTDNSSDILVPEPPVWFSLAYMDDVLRGLAGRATGGCPLVELLN